VETEVGLSCVEEGFSCHRKASFVLEPPRTTQKGNAKKELEESNRGGSGNSCFKEVLCSKMK
jgi:hypothetical protein